MNRSDAVERLLGALPESSGVCSATIVGSFVDREDVSAISDIDTVVVFDRLTPARFAGAVSAVEALRAEDIGFPGRQLAVNATLGPLKYDAPDRVVVHLMLYDRMSHREHVLKSPFTCLDWERSSVHRGTPLAQIYPVGRLRPRDFLGARRSLADYVRDLESGTLSYRRFEPAGDRMPEPAGERMPEPAGERMLEPAGERMIEVPDRVLLDERHRGEYAYHVIRNLVVNSLKMRTGLNHAWTEEDLRDGWGRELPDLAGWIPFYDCLRSLKLTRSASFPGDTLAKTRSFLDGFAASMESAVQDAPVVRFVRHGRTALNDGTFLGRRDPSLADPGSIAADGLSWDAVFASPLSRAQETARALSPGPRIQADARLSEIEYGDVEGLTAGEARQRFPQLARAWDSGEDVPFPGGEGSEDVLRRVRSFLDTPGPHRRLAVTHNVVMRVVAADMLGLDLRKAFRIPIGHLDALDVIRIGGRWVPDFTQSMKEKILDGYTGWRGRE